MRGVPIIHRSRVDSEAARRSYTVWAGPLRAIAEQRAPVRVCQVEPLKCIALHCHV